MVGTIHKKKSSNQIAIKNFKEIREITKTLISSLNLGLNIDGLNDYHRAEDYYRGLVIYGSRIGSILFDIGYDDGPAFERYLELSTYLNSFINKNYQKYRKYKNCYILTKSDVAHAEGLISAIDKEIEELVSKLSQKRFKRFFTFFK